MSLSCSCPDSDEAEWYYFDPEDFTTFQMHKRRRCSSCNALIEKGAICLKFPRYRTPKDDIEIRIHGDGAEIRMTPLFLCEKCGDQYFNLSALGFCVNPKDDVFELLEEYKEYYGPPK
jgi:hypothetical protein